MDMKQASRELETPEFDYHGNFPPRIRGRLCGNQNKITHIKSILFTTCLWCILVACNTQKKIVHSNQPHKPDGPVQVSLNEELQFGDTLIVKVLNVSDQQIVIYSPLLKNIEKLERNKWRKVRILYYPCGSYYEPAPKKLKLALGEIHTLKWNLIESWCGEMQENRIPKLEKRESKSGLYRITIQYSVETGLMEEIRKEFKILE